MSALDYSLSSKISMGFIAPILIFLTILLYAGIIFYEKWGHDPQKRNIFNMMLMSLCKALMLEIIFTILFGSIRIIFGPLGHVGATIGSFSRIYLVIFICLCNVESIFYKILAIYCWAYVACINDLFVYRFLNIVNLILSLIFTLIIWFVRARQQWFYFLHGTGHMKIITTKHYL